LLLATYGLGELAKKRHPQRIIRGTFPAFSGNLYRRGDRKPEKVEAKS
jgi:hypothetical protein